MRKKKSRHGKRQRAPQHRASDHRALQLMIERRATARSTRGTQPDEGVQTEPCDDDEASSP